MLNRPRETSVKDFFFEKTKPINIEIKTRGPRATLLTCATVLVSLSFGISKYETLKKHCKTHRNSNVFHARFNNWTINLEFVVIDCGTESIADGSLAAGVDVDGDSISFVRSLTRSPMVKPSRVSVESDNDCIMCMLPISTFASTKRLINNCNLFK